MIRLVLTLALVLFTFGSLSASAQRTAKPSPVATSTEAVNLNNASATQLADLPGIGLKTAELIVQYRTKNGPFKKIEEVMNVRGVGEKSFLRIKDRLTVTAAKSEK